jgi:G3E family GTPase
LENEEEGEVEEYGISTFVYQRREPFNLPRFDEFVARKWPKSVIRCKGMCYFGDERDTCYVFEQAGKQVTLRNAGQWYATMPADELAEFKAQNPDLRRDWDEHYGDRMQKLVFIGQHLDREAITLALDMCLAKS